MVLETSVVSTFNHLTRLEARENFIKLSRRESLKSYRIPNASLNSNQTDHNISSSSRQLDVQHTQTFLLVTEL
jgi:hypothetical protein